MRNWYYIVGILAMLAVMGGPADAEQITLSTYYPSPYGVYRNLRITPISWGNRPNCLGAQMGSIYYDDGFHPSSPGQGFYQCDGVQWQKLGGGGLWVEEADGDIYYNAGDIAHGGGDVGIGKDNPSYKLDIQDSGTQLCLNGSGTGSDAELWFRAVTDSSTTPGDTARIRANANQGSDTRRLSLEIIDRDGRGWDNGLTIRTTRAGDDFGYVGIGTADPVNRLDVDGAMTVGAAYAGTYTAPVNGMIVEGNVGIGTQNVGALLQMADSGAPMGTVHMKLGGPIRNGFIQNLTQGVTLSANAYYNGSHRLDGVAGTGYRPSRLMLNATTGALNPVLEIDTGTDTNRVNWTPIFSLLRNGAVGVGIGSANLIGNSQMAVYNPIDPMNPMTGGALATFAGSAWGVYGRGWPDSTGRNGTGVMGVGPSNTNGAIGVRAVIGAGNFSATYGVHSANQNQTGYDFYAAGAAINNYGAASSIRWKKNIRPFDNALAKVLNLRGVYFDWDEEHGGKHDMGMIAEEVGKELPEIVVYEEDGIYTSGMDYSKLTPVLVEAIKEQQQQIEELKEKISILERRR